MMLCGNCGRPRGRRRVNFCTCLPSGFWERPQVRQKVHERDAAGVLRLVRQANPRLSQEALARMSGLSQSTMSRLLNGRPVGNPAKAAAALTRLGAPLTAAATPRRVAAEADLNADDHQVLARLLSSSAPVDPAAVRASAQILAAQRRLDDVVGAQAMIPVTMDHLRVVEELAAQARGAHAPGLREVGAEYVQFAGWLHACTGRHGRARSLLGRAEALAAEVGDATLLAQARNFFGYLARREGDVPAIVEHFTRAYTTPGAHPAQRVGDAAQAAQGHALLGERSEALRLLEEAVHLAETTVGVEPPRTAYWLNGTYHRLNLGIAHLALGEADVAADLLASGLDGLPDDQQDADWTNEYRQAWARARAML